MTELLSDIVKRIASTRMPPVVYPGYIAMRIKAAFKLPGNIIDPERVVASVGDMETVGDCRYRITLKDFNGSVYRVTVEMDDACSTPPAAKDPAMVSNHGVNVDGA